MSQPGLSPRARRAIWDATEERRALDEVGLAPDWYVRCRCFEADVLKFGRARRLMRDWRDCGSADPDPKAAARLTQTELLSQRLCGERTVKEIVGWLAGFGLALSEKYVPPHRPFAANVYADWLDENGEPHAAAKLRAAFPLDDGKETA